ncbi:MAG: ABC-2 family transporter protein [Anaerolineae bacterium]
MHTHWDLFATHFRISLMGWVQYRMGLVTQLLAKMVEPIVYLVVWVTIARQSGGVVGGYTENDFIVYFITWTYVRQMTIAWDPFWMESRIRHGEFNALFLRPIHPIYGDAVNDVASKVFGQVFIVPIMLALVLIFRPQFQFVGWSTLAFVPILLMAYVLRYVLSYALAISAFWTTRVTALFQLYIAVEFFVSGRIAPLSVLPAWVQQVASWLPFRWMFYFPLEVLLGRLTPAQTLRGVGFQLAWLVFSALLLASLWRSAARRYTAVGG